MNISILPAITAVLDSAVLQCIIKFIKVSCEIEDLVETHLCNLRGILRSRVLLIRVLRDLISAFTSMVDVMFCRFYLLPTYDRSQQKQVDIQNTRYTVPNTWESRLHYT